MLNDDDDDDFVAVVVVGGDKTCSVSPCFPAFSD